MNCRTIELPDYRTRTAYDKLDGDLRNGWGCTMDVHHLVDLQSVGAQVSLPLQHTRIMRNVRVCSYAADLCGNVRC